MVLWMTTFATIGRQSKRGAIYDNIRKFIKYTMTSNAGEICVICWAVPGMRCRAPLHVFGSTW